MHTPVVVLGDGDTDTLYFFRVELRRYPLIYLSGNAASVLI